MSNQCQDIAINRSQHLYKQLDLRASVTNLGGGQGAPLPFKKVTSPRNTKVELMLLLGKGNSRLMYREEPELYLTQNTSN